MKILITGSTGLVGTALTQDLQRAGHTVCRLVRPNTTTQSIANSQGFDVNWNPVTGELGGAAVGADAVVNLAGASIADGRWTPQRKQLLRSSRVDTTPALSQALAKLPPRPHDLFSTSSTGYYPNRAAQTLTQSTQPGNDFLPELAKEW